MDKTLTLSYYALTNYVEENREAALNSSFKGKRLSECLGVTSASVPADDTAVRSLILDQCDNPVLVSMQLELMMQKSPEEFIGKLQEGLHGEKEDAVKEQKLECLLLMGGELPALEEGVPRLEQLEACYQKLGDAGLSKKILGGMDSPEPPVAALALYLGADKPWVRRRLELSQDVKIWRELVAQNFNTSPKVLLDGVDRLVKSAVAPPDTPVSRDLADSVWSRPDCQLYVAEERKKLQQVNPELKLGTFPELGGLEALASITPKKKARLESVAELCALLDEQLTTRQPAQNLLDYYTAAGCSPAQAKLRAAYCQYAGLEGAGTASPVAARRLAASLHAPRQIDRAAAPGSFGGWAKRIHEFAQKCRAAFAERSPSSGGQPEHLGQIPPHEGYQSWQHKDELVTQIEQQLEKDYELKRHARPDEDPWRFLKVRPNPAPGSEASEPDGPDM
jgi:hypothetical protein